MAQPLGDDEVEVQVKATGLNFNDVTMGVGQIQTEILGGGCAGVMTAVGKDARGLAVGDRVSTYGFGTFCNFYREKWTAVQKIPDDISFEMGAALPVTYGTAYYSVYHLARVEKRDSVLVHAATGGLGQAIIELCQLIGAEIYATVGTQEKKELLVERFKIPEDHIFYSCDGSFARGVMRMTGGRGADVVFNSLAGGALPLSWNCIADYGRFIRLGAHKVWADVMDLFRKRSIQGPSPLHVHRISKVEEALRIMQTGKHIGKLVAVAEPDEVVQAVPRNTSKNLLKPDASYLLVGGLGGNGRATALWMVDHGTENLIFANRSSLAPQKARDTVDALIAKGASVAVYSCDVSNAKAVADLVAESGKSMPPIRGVIQGAMVLRDGLLEKMPVSDYTAVIRPKVQGTWNLHNSLPADMDFFVMLSSVSGVIDNATQAAYAAVSTFMDAFAAYRNSLGLAAVALDLGVIGYLAEKVKELSASMQRQGFAGTNKAKLLALIYHFRRQALKKDSGNADGKACVRDALKAAKALEEAADKICGTLVDKISARSNMLVDNISRENPMTDYGIDSLVAVEMRNWIQLSARIAQRSGFVNLKGGEKE
ncbi:KR domain-containing protein [Lasiosphaeria ovina]|uniref:KR domain-containing protein n=1 Tax=Lasiosphaeria ovina TaxID=92902 RepID=A0AAE0JT31_9PEZI|nr:KR domain-containing protein [Lasiosphaeria ovina]